MSDPGSVTNWIGQLKAGDRNATGPLWEAYFGRLVGLARAKLRGARRRAADEEDVALSALDSFCRGAEAGRFPLLADRDGLWRLLVLITARKAADQYAAENRQKRGGTRVRGESVLLGASGGEHGGLGDFAGTEPTPEFAAQMGEECGRLLGMLDDDLRAVALWRMEGYTAEEIAGRLGCVPRTVERKLRLIRERWQGETGNA